jgi:hypothetical protein
MTNPNPQASPTPRTLLSRTKEAVDLFEQEFARVNLALASGDLSLAQFPRTGNDARIELLTRQSTMQWVLEMMPGLKSLQLDAQQLREQARQLLKLASELDGKSLYAITHSHRHGDDTHFVWARGPVSDEDAAAVIERTSSYEPQHGETLVTTSIALDSICELQGEDVGHHETAATGDTSRQRAS